MRKSVTFYCFSPFVMIATFTIEWLFAAWAFVVYRHTRFGQLAILTLVSLGLFQLAENKICTGGPNQLATTIGLVAITLLPPLGLHLITHITGHRIVTRISYFVAAIFIVGFVLYPALVTSPSVCTGNYIIIFMMPKLGMAYGLYYFGFLFWAIHDALGGRATPELKPYKAVLGWLITGYLSFILPMGIVYFLSEKSREAVPSIMCGFAIILAIILTLRILPLYHRIQKTN
ncbi:MAG: hypothetical protein AAB647_03210 [Patescibacteria group bacterium]